MPVFTTVQVAPLSVERQMPLLLVLTYSAVGVFGLMTSKETPSFVRLVFADFHVPPLLTERKTPYSVPTYSVVAVMGLIAMETILSPPLPSCGMVPHSIQVVPPSTV